MSLRNSFVLLRIIVAKSFFGSKVVKDASFPVVPQS